MKLAILTPTRGRPAGLMRLYESIRATISGKHQIYFVYWIDEDDEAIHQYAALEFHKHKNITIMAHAGPRQPIAKTFNFMAKWHAIPYYMNGADDMAFNTPGWDEILSTKLSHPYCMYYFDDGIQHEGLATFAIVSRTWVNAIGYLFPEDIRHNYIDTYIFDVAKRAGSEIYIPEVSLSHFHFTVGGSAFDKTYEESQQWWAQDTDAYNRLETRRDAEAQMLRDLIERWRNTRAMAQKS